MSQWETVKDRAAGKWQMPLLVVSVILLAGSLFRIHPSPAKLPLDEAVEYLEKCVAAGRYDDAIAFGDLLLVRKEYTDADRAPVHLHLARACYGEAARRRVRTANVGRRIIEHYQHTSARAQPLTAYDYENMGRAFEWQRQFANAVEQYDNALEQGVKHPLDLTRHVLSLKLDKVETPPGQLLEPLDRLMGDAGDRRLDLRLWAIERKLELLESLGRLDEATTLLTRNRDRFHASDLRDRFAYLEAWLLYKGGHFDETETYLRTIRNRVERKSEVYAMTGWLLGRVVMRDDDPQRPQEALSFFTDAIAHHPDGPYAVASRLGCAETLAMLERSEEALEAYRIVIEDLETLGRQRLVNRAALRASLGVMADARRRAGRLKDAVEYARLAVELIEPTDVERSALFLQQLAQMQSLFADQLDEESAAGDRPLERMIEASSREAREMFADAGMSYLRLAQINAMNERLAAEATWRAAELYARAGDRNQAASLYRAFAAERPQHPLVARALLRIGWKRQLKHTRNATGVSRVRLPVRVPSCRWRSATWRWGRTSRISRRRRCVWCWKTPRSSPPKRLSSPTRCSCSVTR